MISKGYHVRALCVASRQQKHDFLFFRSMPGAHYSCQCIIKQPLDSLGNSADNPCPTLIILDIRKTLSNNCILSVPRRKSTISFEVRYRKTVRSRTATGIELVALLTCPHTTTFTILMLSIFSLLEISSLKIWETIRSWHAKYSYGLQTNINI